MSFRDACAEHVLDNAGPFTRFSEEALTYLGDYLARAPEGQKMSRAEMFNGEVDMGRASFFRKLAFAGAFACKAGLERIDRAVAMGEKPSYDLELPDAEYGKRMASMAGTIACPGNPD